MPPAVSTSTPNGLGKSPDEIQRRRCRPNCRPKDIASKKRPCFATGSPSLMLPSFSFPAFLHPDSSAVLQEEAVYAFRKNIAFHPQLGSPHSGTFSSVQCSATLMVSSSSGDHQTVLVEVLLRTSVVLRGDRLVPMLLQNS